MTKLFSREELDSLHGETEPLPNVNTPVVNLVDPAEYAEDLEIIMEAFKTASSDLKTITGISTSLAAKKPASVDYFTSLEHHSVYLSHIEDNLGVKSKVPSLETFQAPRAFEASHKVAMEGFFDYVKKIWDKLKSFFAAFFKKIKLFIKRLFNAQLEIEEYEEYLDDLVPKIRRNGGTLTDPSAQLSSKLPSFLASLGMVDLTAHFVAHTGSAKMTILSNTINEVFTGSLKQASGAPLTAITKTIKSMVHQTGPVSLQDLQQKAIDLRTYAGAMLSCIFPVPIGDIQDLPSDIQVGIQDHFTTDQYKTLPGLSRKLLETRDYTTDLPKRFNAYYFLSSDGNLYVASTRSDEDGISEYVPPVQNAETLYSLYEDYKKFSNGIQPSRISEVIEDLSDGIDDILDLMRGEYAKLMEKVTSSNEVRVAHVLTNTEDIQTSVKTLENTQRFVINFLMGVQVIIKDSAMELLGTHQELRFAMAKYLYDSARLYKV